MTLNHDYNNDDDNENDYRNYSNKDSAKRETQRGKETRNIEPEKKKKETSRCYETTPFSKLTTHLSAAFCQESGRGACH